MRNPRLVILRSDRKLAQQNLHKGNLRIEDNECQIVVRVYDIRCCTAACIETRGMQFLVLINYFTI